MTWFLGRAHSLARSTVRAASAGSRWKECASSQSVEEAEDDSETTPRDSASWIRPTRAQSSWTAKASIAAALSANPSLPVRQSSDGSLANSSVAAARNPVGSVAVELSNMCSSVREETDIRKAICDEYRCKQKKSTTSAPRWASPPPNVETPICALSAGLEQLVPADIHHGEWQEPLAGGPDLDRGVHRRADATVETRCPSAVLDLDVTQSVLPVLPQPVLVEAGVDVVPGQNLVLLALPRREPGNIDGLFRQSRCGSTHPALVVEVFAPAIEPGTVTPCRLDDLADSTVTATQQPFDDSGLAIVVAESDGRCITLVGPDHVTQLLQPRVGLLGAELGAPLERCVGLGHEPADRHGATDVALTADPPPGLDDPLGQVGDLQHVLVGLGGQAAHEVQLHVAPAGGEGGSDGVDQVVLADRLVDHSANALGPGLGRERQT